MFRLRKPLLALLVGYSLVTASGVDDNDPKLIRWRMQQILKDVSHTVETSFYDPKLNGVDWQSSVETAHQQIEKADHLGQMIGAITALLARLNDSHTVFIPPRRTERAFFGFDAKPFGDEILVYDVMPKGPADSAGLQLGDQIVGVNDFDANRGNIEIMLRYFEYLDPVRELRLAVKRGNREQAITVESELRSEFSKDFEHLYRAYANDRIQAYEPTEKEYEGGVVYLRLTSFLGVPHDEGSFVGKANNARAVILDLRGNGGGRDDTMAEVASHFFHERDKIADLIGRTERVAVEITPRNPSIACPLFVLVDSNSASASEMLARFIQIKHRGKIVGDRTAGWVNASRMVPGTVGSVYMVRYALEVTVGRVVMADGQGLEGRGVVPDELCVLTRDDLRSGKDRCLDRAIELARASVSEKSIPSTD
jgi:carboxyl-terminal processing protease